MAIGVGDTAPDFTLRGTGDVAYTLSELRGAPVVLAFYPGDNTPVCTKQLDSYQGDLASFDAVGAKVFGISPQSVESHDEFSCKRGYKFPLLADTDKKVGEAYGVLGPLGFYRRSVFVIDADGIVRYVHRAIAGMTFRSSNELIAAVKAAS
ncbi:MAG TPA: peroxiredoxin [Acidimicrobiales bacterium]|nr:peroxiredoxin [Acidimicrobiales bacterium]